MILRHHLHNCLSQTFNISIRLATAVVFSMFDLLESLLRPVFIFLDKFMHCDAHNDCRKETARWSDCACNQCATWINNHHKLYSVVKAPSHSKSSQHVIFLHGFLGSSSFWAQTIFPHLSLPNCTLHAVDLLGFGRSAKPYGCDYTVEDHVNAVKDSVIDCHALTSFHIVAHSMGCIIAVALAEKFPERVKSITLVAPPLFSCSEDVLKKIAQKRLWPPLLFGIAFMSWYEHLGRCFCLFFCKNHRAWERLLKLVFRRREHHFLLEDMWRHTHHSAWHSMHNVVCLGQKCVEECLRTIVAYKVKVCVMHGRDDELVPIECVEYIRKMVPHALAYLIDHAKHDTVIIGREMDFASDLMGVLQI